MESGILTFQRRVSKMLMCTRIVWICFENIGADSVGLGWSLKFCISENLPGDAGVDAAG